MTEETEIYNFEAVLFDLDGTLLRAQMTTFIQRYVHALATYCADQIKPKRFEKAMLLAIWKLIHEPGDGQTTNQERALAYLQSEVGLPPEVLKASLEHLEQNGLDDLQSLIHPVPLAQKIIADCAAMNIPLVLATNPVFPRFMIEARIRWAGLDQSSFTHITSCENSYHCKPQLGYFSDIAALLDIEPKKCLMVGNDINHDLAAVGIGMEAYLVDTWLVERDGPDWPCKYRGDHSDLQQFLSHHIKAR